ncbi:GGDEF domain-containing protein [Hyphomonas sp.]|uniref:GGDEF domain-containing protein n=1 Tax=Hyphomonas sp. TaxID=87 RepID=UPI003918D3E1
MNANALQAAPAPKYAAQRSFREVCQAAIRVFNLMDKYHTAPFPNAYAVWFAYTTGSNEALIADINGLVALKDQLSPYDIDSLFQEYLAGDESSFVTHNISEAIGNEISSVLEIIESGLKQNDAFTSTLDAFAEKVPDVSSEEGLAAVVSSLLEENRRMAATTRALTDGLARSQTLIGVLNQQLEEVQAQAMRDPVTSVANRRAFDKHLADTASRAEKLNTGFCVALADITNFSGLIEIYGQDAADSLLGMVATQMAAGLNEGDMVARYGGEMFAFILPETELMPAYNTMVKIKHALAGLEYTLSDTGEVISGVLASFGLARAEPGTTADEIIALADSCLQEARQSGRSTIKARGLA